jgi:hypothetical protein
MSQLPAREQPPYFAYTARQGACNPVRDDASDLLHKYDPRVVMVAVLPATAFAPERFSYGQAFDSTSSSRRAVRFVNAMCAVAYECGNDPNPMNARGYTIVMERGVQAGVPREDMIPETIVGTGPSVAAWIFWFLPRFPCVVPLDQQLQRTHRLRHEFVSRLHYILTTAQVDTTMYSRYLEGEKENLEMDLSDEPGNEEDDPYFNMLKNIVVDTSKRKSAVDDEAEEEAPPSKRHKATKADKDPDAEDITDKSKRGRPARPPPPPRVITPCSFKQLTRYDLQASLDDLCGWYDQDVLFTTELVEQDPPDEDMEVDEQASPQTYSMVVQDNSAFECDLVISDSEDEMEVDPPVNQRKNTNSFGEFLAGSQPTQPTSPLFSQASLFSPHPVEPSPRVNPPTEPPPLLKIPPTEHRLHLLESHDTKFTDLFSVATILEQSHDALNSYLREGLRVTATDHRSELLVPKVFALHPLQYPHRHARERGFLQLVDDPTQNGSPADLMIYISRSHRIPVRAPDGFFDWLMLPGYRPEQHFMSRQFAPMSMTLIETLQTDLLLKQLNRTGWRIGKDVETMQMVDKSDMAEICEWGADYYHHILLQSANSRFWLVEPVFANSAVELESVKTHCRNCKFCDTLLKAETLFEAGHSALETLLHLMISIWSQLGHTHSFGLMLSIMCNVAVQLPRSTVDLQPNVQLVGPGGTGKSRTMELVLRVVFQSMQRLYNGGTRASMTVGLNPFPGIYPKSQIIRSEDDKKIVHVSDMNKDLPSWMLDFWRQALTENVIVFDRATINDVSDDKLQKDNRRMVCRSILAFSGNGMPNDSAFLSRFSIFLFKLRRYIDRLAHKTGGKPVGRKEAGLQSGHWCAINMESLSASERGHRQCVELYARQIIGRHMLEPILFAPFLSTMEFNNDMLLTMYNYDSMLPKEQRCLTLEARVSNTLRLTSQSLSRASMMQLLHHKEFKCLSRLQMMALLASAPVSFEAIMYALTSNPATRAALDDLDDDNEPLVQFFQQRIEYVEHAIPEIIAKNGSLYVKLRTPPTQKLLTQELSCIQAKMPSSIALSLIDKMKANQFLDVQTDASHHTVYYMDIIRAKSVIFPVVTTWFGHLQQLLNAVVAKWDKDMRNLVIKQTVEELNQFARDAFQRANGRNVQSSRKPLAFIDLEHPTSPFGVVTIDGKSYYVMPSVIHRNMGIQCPNMFVDHQPKSTWSEYRVEKADWVRACTLLFNQDRRLLHPQFTKEFAGLAGVDNLPALFERHMEYSSLFRASMSARGITDFSNPYTSYTETGNPVYFLVQADYVETIRHKVYGANSCPLGDRIHSILLPGHLRPAAGSAPVIPVLSADGELTGVKVLPSSVFMDKPLYVNNQGDSNRRHKLDRRVQTPLPGSLFAHAFSIQLHDHWVVYASVSSLLAFFARHQDPLSMIHPQMVTNPVPFGRKLPAWPCLAEHTKYNLVSNRPHLLIDMEDGIYVMEIYCYNLVCVINYLCARNKHSQEKIYSTVLPGLGAFVDAMKKVDGLEEIYKTAALLYFDWHDYVFPWADAKPIATNHT